MKNLKISVAVVTFNANETLELTIQSVLSQSYQNRELVIIDGQSTDGTIETINKYSDVIKWVSEPDKGIYDAMNKVRKIANGDYLIFLGADDVLHSSNVIEEFVHYVDDMSVIYYGNVIFKGPEVVYWGKFNKWKWGIGNVSHQAVFYPRCIFDKYDYDLKYKIYADYAFNLKLIEKGEKFKYIPIIVTDYSLDGISANSIDLAFEQDKLKCIRKAVGVMPMLYGVLYRTLQKYVHK